MKALYPVVMAACIFSSYPTVAMQSTDQTEQREESSEAQVSSEITDNARSTFRQRSKKYISSSYHALVYALVLGALSRDKTVFDCLPCALEHHLVAIGISELFGRAAELCGNDGYIDTSIGTCHKLRTAGLLCRSAYRHFFHK